MELCLINTEIITSEKKDEKLNVSIFFKPRPHAIYLLFIVFRVHTNTAVMRVERGHLKGIFFSL